MRIDYVLLSAQSRRMYPARCHTPHTTFSDHRPVVVDFELLTSAPDLARRRRRLLRQSGGTQIRRQRLCCLLCAAAAAVLVCAAVWLGCV